MGYDCTLHLIDEKRLQQRFVDRLLDPELSGDSFDQNIDAPALWAQARAALQGDSVSSSASLIAQLSLLFMAAEEPYHYERGFCLALWSDGPVGNTTEIPKRFIGNPEDLFARLVTRYPQLKGRFPRTIEQNFSTGIYVPSAKVPALLKWVRKCADDCEASDAFVFRGLLLVLEQAAERGLAYWEATDLPLEMRTIRPATKTPGAEEWEYPEKGYGDCLGGLGETVLVTNGPGMECWTMAIDIRTWPPTFKTIPEFTLAFARSAQGKWLFVSADRQDNYRYLVRVRNADLCDNARILRQPLCVSQAKNGFDGAGFVGERVVAFSQFQKGVSPPRVPLIENNGVLANAQGVKPLNDNHTGNYIKGGVEPSGCVVRLKNGHELVLWNGVGYEFTDESTLAPVVAKIGKLDRWTQPSVVPWESDAFIFVGSLGPRQLMFARLGISAVRVAPKIENPMAVEPGPGASLLVKQGDNKKRWIGVIWFPNEQTFIPLDKNVIADEDPQKIDGLFYSQSTGRLIATTSERLWSTEMEPLLKRPRFSANSGRMVK